MKHNTFLLSIILTPLVCTAQNPRDYQAFSNTKQLIVSDNFAVAPDSWDCSMSKYGISCDSCISSYYNLQDSSFVIQSKCDSDFLYYKDFDLNYSRNFEIVLIAKVGSDTDRYIRNGFLCWSWDNKEAVHNMFSFSGYRRYLFHTHNLTNGLKINTHKHYKDRKTYSYTHYVRYTIRKYDDKFYFFVNGWFIGKGKVRELPGIYLGVGVRKQATASYKHISIYYLP